VPDKVRFLTVGLASAVFAFWITGLKQTSPDVTLGYVFLCGIIGICAMILPGLSGAYLLLVLGLYSHLTSILHRLAHGALARDDLITVVVFGCGCAIGLVSFSKVLKWLLANYRRVTMAILSGFMIGALRKVWPFQHDLVPSATSLKEKLYEPIMPTAIDNRFWHCLQVALLAAILVFTIDYVARRRSATAV
jgi:putative membrane protein